MLKNRIITMVIIGIASLFIWALFDSFALRFERGDIYPPYSSFRSDPVGCKVLFDSLKLLPNIRVKRLLRPINEISNTDNSVMIITGIQNLNRLSRVRGLNSYLLRGGKLLIFCHPIKRERQEVSFIKISSKADHNKGKAKPDITSNKQLNKSRSAVATVTAAEKNLPLKHPPFQYLSLKLRHKLYRLPLTAEPTAELRQAAMPSLPLYTYGYLKIYDRAWHTLYRCHNRPVIIQAQYSTGSVTVSAASYFIANEAMLKSPPVKLLAYLIGDRKQIIFNEQLNGVEQQHNIAWLIKKYHLPLLLLNLLTVALLYAWRSIFSSANHIQRPQAYQLQQEQFSVTSGLTKLLRRHIAPAQLLPQCLTEWRRQPDPKKMVDERQLQKYSAASGSNVERYNAIVETRHTLSLQQQNK